MYEPPGPTGPTPGPATIQERALLRAQQQTSYAPRHFISLATRHYDTALALRWVHTPNGYAGYNARATVSHHIVSLCLSLRLSLRLSLCLSLCLRVELAVPVCGVFGARFGKVVDEGGDADQPRHRPDHDGDDGACGQSLVRGLLGG